MDHLGILVASCTWIISFKHRLATFQSKEIKDTLGVDFRACQNYTNGFDAAKKLNLPTLSILADKDRMCRLKDGQKWLI